MSGYDKPLEDLKKRRLILIEWKRKEMDGEYKEKWEDEQKQCELAIQTLQSADVSATENAKLKQELSTEKVLIKHWQNRFDKKEKENEELKKREKYLEDLASDHATTKGLKIDELQAAIKKVVSKNEDLQKIVKWRKVQIDKVIKELSLLRRPEGS